MTQQDDDIARDRQTEILGRFFGLDEQEFEDWAIAQPDADLIGEFLLSMLKSEPLPKRKNTQLPGQSHDDIVR